MRPPTRIPSHPPNPYDELAQLSDPEPGFEPYGHDGRGYDQRAYDQRGYGGLGDDERGYDEHDPLGLGLKPDHDAGVRSGDDPADDSWTPPNHRGRGRLAAVSTVVKVAVAALVCTGFLFLADRFAELYAQNKAAEKLQQSLHLVTRPEVDIHGFPFLTQVLDKHLDRVDVSVPDVAADRVSLAEVRASAKDIRINGDLPSSIKGAVVGSMDGDVFLSFADMNRELGASQVKFTDEGHDSINVRGALPVAGTEVRVRAQAHVRRDGGQAVSTTVDHMQVDVPGIATYTPGRDRAHSGLRLAPEAAARIAREKNHIRALLSVPSVVDRIGVPQKRVQQALHSDDELHRLAGTPRFAHQLMQVNLVDEIVAHPWLLQKAGIDPKLISAVMSLRPPQLSSQFSLSFKLPKAPGDIRLRHVVVEKKGIRADLAGSGLHLGKQG
ncbi:LmeA family phospholipid-binding protein [Streptomyces sp. NBC_00388]|uniref:LmeA family phospholipid-binding protein n=1 Tax=Streptomyces sp. NBC_00388 TaxID=2975735 RepID=UPI002E214E9D